MSTVIAFARGVIRVYLGVAMAALVVMMMSIVLDVFMRYTFNSPVQGTFDLVEICLAVTVFYGMGAAIIGFHEIVIDLIDHLAPPAVVRLLCRTAGVLSLLVLLFIFKSMITPAIQSWQYNEMRLELKIPNGLVWTIALVGMFGGLLASVVNVLQPGRVADLPRSPTQEAA